MMFLPIIIIGLVLYYGFNGSEKFPVSKKNDPIELLKERFVRGEIDEKTYDQMREVLKK